jgi:alkylation response protein AidB-like acyl-CoA dehydrogenase
METVLRQADYSLTEDQEALRDTFVSFFERECPTTRVRDAEPGGFDADLWKRLAEMRAVAMGVPEPAGGDGAGLEELGLVAEQVGHRLAPVPLIEAVVAARAVAAAGITGSDHGLADAVEGAAILALALHPGGGAQLVPAGAVAQGVVGLVGDDLVLARCTTPPAQPANQGYAPIAWWNLGDGAIERVTLASGEKAQLMYERACREWKLLTASALIGMGQAVLDIGVEHAKSRVAFGAPIGTFQAVSHSLADVAMAVDSGRRLLAKAIWFQEHEPDSDRYLVPMAYLYAQEAAMEAATVGVHVLGGVGFTVESDAPLYFRRVKGWSLLTGDPQSELGELADQLFGPAGEPAA